MKKKKDDFKIEISKEKLNKWPEKGDLVDMIPECHIVDNDKDNEDNRDNEKDEKQKSSDDNKRKK